MNPKVIEYLAHDRIASLVADAAPSRRRSSAKFRGSESQSYEAPGAELIRACAPISADAIDPAAPAGQPTRTSPRSTSLSRVG
jgi:hypothetical protein